MGYMAPFRRIEPAMVTVARGGAAALACQPGRAVAAKASRPAPWGDLFSGYVPPRGALRATARHAAVAAAKAARRPRPLRPSADKPDKEAAGSPERQARPAGRCRHRSPTPQPSACRLALTDAIAIAPSIPDIKGAGGCGGEDLVRLEAIVLPDKRQVSVKPAAILRCPDGVPRWPNGSAAISRRWRSASAQRRLRSRQFRLSFECRGRNRVVGAKLSEHGRANARRRPRLRSPTARYDLADRPHRAAGLRENVLHSRLHAVLDGASGPGFGRVPRGPHPSRPDGTAATITGSASGTCGTRLPQSSAAIAGRAARTKRRRAKSPPRRRDEIGCESTVPCHADQTAWKSNAERRG